jgi:hypothetical protein
VNPIDCTRNGSHLQVPPAGIAPGASLAGGWINSSRQHAIGFLLVVGFRVRRDLKPVRLVRTTKVTLTAIDSHTTQSQSGPGMGHSPQAIRVANKLL